ncbi:MAG: flagellar biosynthesis anti-sigma factor FlgM [Clostridiales bacterium]|jgi:negative regulator of flagellin synthesis FlgM|nr:flagellar biosynthesis anti-sigma factor FlgM [Clostridiales bacterium]
MDTRIGSTYGVLGEYKVLAYKAEETKRAGKTEEKHDELAMSAQAQSFSALRKALSGIPDLREERIGELRQKIESGVYDVSSSDVADKILERALGALAW